MLSFSMVCSKIFCVQLINTSVNEKPVLSQHTGDNVLTLNVINFSNDIV